MPILAEYSEKHITKPIENSVRKLQSNSLSVCACNS